MAAGAGGGGGGSNLVPEGGTATLDDSGVPSIVISYQGGLGEEPPTEPEDKQACKKGGYDALRLQEPGPVHQSRQRQELIPHDEQ